MPSSRLVVAAVLLALLAGAAGALALWSRAPPSVPGEHEVHVLGPDGPLFQGTLHLDDATALGALLAAATRAGLEVELEEYPGMGAYVRAVGPHRAHGASGWVYEVRHAGEWTFGDRSAAFATLAPGDAVRWTWKAA